MSTAPRRAVALVLLAGVSHGLFACSSAPPPIVVPPPPPSPNTKLSSVLRLENQRMLADPPVPVPVVEFEEDADGDGVAPAGAGPEAAVTPATDGPEAAAEPPAPPPRPDLLALATDEVVRVRQRAALAVGRVGAPAGVSTLVSLLADPEAAVRGTAAFSLGLLGDATASDALASALDDASPVVQGRAAQALARLDAASAAPAIGAMVARHVSAAFDVAPDDQTYPPADELEAFRLGVQALGDLRAFDALAAAVLGDDGQPVLWWWPVSYALGRTGDIRALPALITLAGIPGDVSVALAAEGLGRLGDPRGVRPLTALLDLDRRPPRVVAGAVRALGRIDGPAAAEALNRFVRRRELDPTMRLAAVDALARHGARDAVEVYVELLSHPWAPLRAGALRALARADPASFLFALSGLGRDPDWRVRAAGAEGLGWSGSEAAARRLVLMLDDEDRRMIPAVLESLVALQGAVAAPVLRARLDEPDVAVRETAARLMGELRLPDASAALADAYETATNDASHRVRAAVVDALSASREERATATLRRALADDDWPVRVRAAEALRQRGFELDDRDVGPAPGLRRIDFADPALVNAAVAPRVFLDTEHGAIVIELDVADAPMTTESFMTLARQGFFTGLTVRRRGPDAEVVSGDPRGDGRGGPGYTLRDEPTAMPFVRGAVGMWSDRADGGGSQFFITVTPEPQRDGRDTIVGHVVSGMEVVDRLRPDDVIQRTTVWDGEPDPATAGL